VGRRDRLSRRSATAAAALGTSLPRSAAVPTGRPTNRSYAEQILDTYARTFNLDAEALAAGGCSAIRVGDSPCALPAPCCADQPTGPRAGGPTVVLTHLAVDPAGQGCGVGTELTAAFFRAAASVGAGRVFLTTLAGADGAGGFYRARGWRLIGHSRDFDGRPIEVYSRPASPGASPAEQGTAA
jgi:GNAT superfamily N-acetyltransferase